MNTYTELYVQERIGEWEEHLGLGPDGNTSHCPVANQPYVTLAGSQEKPEGMPVNSTYPTVGEAWMSWYGSFLNYTLHRTGPIYWRQRPSLTEDGEGRYFVYGRLYMPEVLIGDTS